MPAAFSRSLWRKSTTARFRLSFGTRRRGFRCPTYEPNETRPPLRVASYNIHKCRGLDGVTRPDRIIEVIRELGADVVALQEVDRRFGRRGGLLDPSAIECDIGMRLLVQSDVAHRHGWHGNALLVRSNPITYRRSRLKLPGGEPRGAIVAELDLGEGEFRVIAAHLGLFRRSRVDQVSALLTAFL